MSMEAQFYEAMRRQHIIERRQSLGVSKQVQQPKYQSRYIADGVLHQDDMHLPWPSNPLRRTKLATSEQNLHQTNEQSHLKRTSLTNRPVLHGKLHNRFSSMNYVQQW